MPDVSAPTGMSLTQARAWVRQFARNAGSSTMYANEDVDRAIMFVGDRFCRMTRALKKYASSELLATSDPDIDFTGLTRFRPNQLVSAHIDGEEDPLEVVEWAALLEEIDEDDSEGVPTLLAFADWTTAKVHKTPDDDYTLHVRWWDRFSLDIADVGTATPGSVVLNIPTDWLTEILTYGVPAALQHHEPEHMYASQSWAKYLEFENRMKGAGGLGVRAVTRKKFDE
jgi:hypothetical protein